MSDTDSFIDEVTEEVRRDRLFLLFKRYGWIGVLVIAVIVVGTGFDEYRKAQNRAAAENLGDSMLSAMALEDSGEQADALATITAKTPGGAAALQFLLSAAQSESDQIPAAVAGLEQVASNGDLPEIYRQIASFKALTLQNDTLPAADRRIGFEALTAPGAPLRLLAQEQLALIDIAQDKPDAAIERLQAILQDAEISRDLQQRATQVIVALGGTPQTRPDFDG